MSVRGLTEIALRIWGLMLLVRVLGALPSNVLMLLRPWDGDRGGAMRASQLGNLAAIVLIAAAGVILLVFARAIAARLAGEETTVATNVTARDAFTVGAILLGIVFLVSGARELVSAAYTLALKPSWDETRGMSYVWDRHAQILPGAIVEIIAGALLLARRRTYAERWFGE